MSFHYLTKSRYLQGLQCPKLLWLSVNEPEAAGEPDEETEHRFAVGTKIGVFARELFPKGVLIAEDHLHLADAGRSTEAAMKAGAPAIFEATVLHKGLACRADILQRVMGRRDCWNIIEVKMSSKVKPVHHDDLAFQRYCFECAGFNILKTSLMHVNTGYIRVGELDPKELLTDENITETVSEKAADIGSTVKKLSAILTNSKCPEIAAGKQCLNPYECPFFDRCNEPAEEYSIYELPYGQRIIPTLEERGIEFLKDIPPDIKLSPRHEKMVLSVKRRKPIIDRKAIKEYLDTLVYPLYYFDFETINSAIPPFDNWKPYQTTPFQFSLHIQTKKGGACEHHQFLQKEAADPREPLMRQMIKLLGKKGSIIAWNMSFETSKITGFAERFPKYEKPLFALLPRFWDLMLPFKEGDYTHYNFHGSASLKAVLPVLSPSLSYEDLEIQEGGTASLKYERWLFGEMEAEEWDKTYWDLLNYCKLDTLAMVEILRVLYQNI